MDITLSTMLMQQHEHACESVGCTRGAECSAASSRQQQWGSFPGYRNMTPSGTATLRKTQGRSRDGRTYDIHIPNRVLLPVTSALHAVPLTPAMPQYCTRSADPEQFSSGAVTCYVHGNEPSTKYATYSSRGRVK